MESAAKAPWWQMTRTPTTGFWLGGLWLVFSVTRWWSLEPSGTWVGPASGTLFTLLGASYLASAAADLRRRRAAAAG